MSSTIRPLIGKGWHRAAGTQADPFRTVSWLDGRIVFDHRWLSCREGELAWTAPSHLLVLTDEGGTARTQVRIAGERAYEGLDRPGALSFVPAQADRVSAYREVDLVYTALWIDPAILNDLRGGEAGQAPPPTVNAGDGLIATLMASLRDEVLAERRLDSAYLEHLVALLLLRLSRLDGAPGPGGGRCAPFNKVLMARLHDYIEANLACDISLADLAALVGMPVDSFARRFRASTGLSPYAYVIERRVRRAESLLKTSDKAIGEIAHALGFSSQSHLTTTFRRVLGTTPSAYRRNFLPGS